MWSSLSWTPPWKSDWRRSRCHRIDRSDDDHTPVFQHTLLRCVGRFGRSRMQASAASRPAGSVPCWAAPAMIGCGARDPRTRGRRVAYARQPDRISLSAETPICSYLHPPTGLRLRRRPGRFPRPLRGVQLPSARTPSGASPCYGMESGTDGVPPPPQWRCDSSRTALVALIRCGPRRSRHSRGATRPCIRPATTRAPCRRPSMPSTAQGRSADLGADQQPVGGLGGAAPSGSLDRP